MQIVRVNCELSTPQHHALLFFALTLEEQLFDITDDSFKAPALNTYTRTLELQAVAEANHSAGISKDALAPFIDELEWSVAKDVVLNAQQKSLCRLHLDTIRKNMGESDRIARGASGLRTVLGDYFESLTLRLRDTIANQPKNRDDIVALAATFIVQAETLGYPRRHTYHAAQNVLVRSFRKSVAIEPPLLLDRFLKEFTKKAYEFSCLFLVSGPFEDHPNLTEAFLMSLSDESPAWEGVSKPQQLFLNKKTLEQKYLVVDGIKARSPAQAHRLAADVFDEFDGVSRFFSHRVSFSRTSLSLVLNKDLKKVYHVRDAPDPMHCWVSHTVADEDAMLEFALVTHSDQCLVPASAEKLRRALRLHRSALLSNSAENQLIDLWASLEGLVSRPGKESQKLGFFSDCLLPAITLSYPEKLFTSVYRDICKASPKAKEEISKALGDDSTFSKFIRVTLCDAHKEIREKVVKELMPYPLVLNKAAKLHRMFGTPEKCQITLKKHRQKVGWHLARIYHTRNSIMHSAQALPHLPTLVENLHVYVDTLIKAIQKTAHLAEEKITIDGAIQYLSVWERYRLQGAEDEGQKNKNPIDDGNVWAVVFGDQLVLAPNQRYEPRFLVAED